VPSSLGWDLVGLVRPGDDPTVIGAAELVRGLEEDLESPLYQRIDLTGEQPEITLKQGSLAPGLKVLLSRKSPLHRLSYNDQYIVILRYFIALREYDGDSWGRSNSLVYRARVIRAFLRLLSDLLRIIKKSPMSISAAVFGDYFKRIDKKSLDTDRIRAHQGSAGIKAIYEELRRQVLQGDR
jgi:hypothetical protein